MAIPVERRLFATGDSLAVTLPRSWIKYLQLNAGDSVEILPDEELVIRVPRGEYKNIDYIQT